MPAGLFGKLPAKRDFVAANVSRRFLEVWEPWLQASVATSRQMLGDGWTRCLQSRADLALLARRRVSAARRSLGAFMASIDGVGRSFPLTIFAAKARRRCRRRRSIQRSLVRGGGGDRCSTRSHREAEFRGVRAGGCERCRRRRCSARVDELSGHRRSWPMARSLVRDFGARTRRSPFARRGASAIARLSPRNRFWWTIGGEGFPPLGACRRGSAAADAVRRHADGRVRRVRRRVDELSRMSS